MSASFSLFVFSHILLKHILKSLPKKSDARNEWPGFSKPVFFSPSSEETIWLIIKFKLQFLFSQIFECFSNDFQSLMLLLNYFPIMTSLAFMKDQFPPFLEVIKIPSLSFLSQLLMSKGSPFSFTELGT